MKRVFLVLTFSSLLLGSCTFENAKPMTAECLVPVSYSTDIDTIISVKCGGCHGTGSSDGNLTDYAVLKTKVESGVFYTRVLGAGKDMPLGGPALPEDEFRKLKCWVEQGALNN